VRKANEDVDRAAGESPRGRTLHFRSLGALRQPGIGISTKSAYAVDLGLPVHAIVLFNRPLDNARAGFTSHLKSRTRRIGCLILIWTAGVIALAVVPVLFRMNAARLT
jgi:hypothetical protein